MAPWDEEPINKESFTFLLNTITGVNSNMNCCFVTFASLELVPMMLEVFNSPGCSWFDPTVVVWHKTNSIAQGNKFIKAMEFMIFAWRTSSQQGYWNYPADEPALRHNVWNVPNIGNACFRIPGRTEAINPTQKPAELLRRIVVHHTKPGGLVLDLCAGSHSLMMVCIEEGRNCYSFEKDKVQHDAALSFAQLKVEELGEIEQQKQKEALEMEVAKKAREEERRKLDEGALILRAGEFMYSRQITEGFMEEDQHSSITPESRCFKCNELALPGELFHVCLVCVAVMHKACSFSEVLGHTLADGNFRRGYVCSKECYDADPGTQLADQAETRKRKRT